MSAALHEAADIRAEASAWLKGLVAAGLPAASIGAGVLAALVEMMLANAGCEKTAVWLHNMARLVDDCGDEWLRAIALEDSRNVR